MKFKHHLLILSFFVLSHLKSSAQMEVQKDFEGKVYFDSAKTRLKEAYEYKVRFHMVINPRTNEPVFQGSEEVKNGLYIRYYYDGTIECTGYYRNDVACGHWKYFDHQGKLKKEEHHEGECFLNGRQ